MGVSSSTLKKKIRKAAHMGTSASSSRKKKTETDPVEISLSSSQQEITESPFEIAASSSQVNEMEPSKISYLTDGSLVYGREDDKKKIIQLLLSDNCKSDNVTIICTVGANGIGKTTLAQLIFTNKGVEDAFDERIFIVMYEQFSEKKLMKALLESLTGAPCDITEPNILENIVKEELTGKKLLLVLDSVENKNKDFWDFLMVLLSVASKGSAVLVTTSMWRVANIIGATHCYQLGYISHTDCWLIFQQLAFSGNDPNAQPELVEICKRLITKCACNTLCIKMLGGLLSCSAMGEWGSVYECGSWDMDISGGKVLPVLWVCYEFLPSHLKHCFAYCSLFPKGYIFSKDHLVCLWLSQGFIQPVVGRDLEDIGFQCFEELCYRSFFYHSPLHNARDGKFVMHELVHDLAQYVSMNECLRSEDCMHIIPKDVHQVALVPSEYQSVTLNHVVTEAKDLKSFLVINRFNHDSILSPIIDLVGLSDVFVKLSSLRVLDLSNTDLEDLPCSIGSLRNLYYLGISNTKIRSIPQEIGNLINLYTLEAKCCYNLVELPQSIPKLTNIRYLDVSNEAGVVGMPVGIGKMTNLQSLATFNVGSDETHCGIEELKHLERLKGSLHITGLENVTSGLDAKEANLINKHFLKNLFLLWSDNAALIEEDEDIELHEKILENLQPSKNLEELVIRNYAGGQFPIWIGDTSFSKLVSVILDSCPNCGKLPSLGKLPKLKYLSVQKLYGVDTMEVSKFPCLEVLNLWEMYDFQEWPEIGNGDLLRLRTLSISQCPMLKSIPCFPSLVELSFHYCSQLPEFLKLHSLETLKIEGLLKAKCICLPHDLIALKKLEISYCSELSSLEGLSKLTSIEMLKIIQCPKLDVGDWQPNPSKSVESSKLLFEEVDDCDISETKNTGPKGLSRTDIQLKNEIEEILANEKFQKGILKQYVERLKQETQRLERGEDKKLTNEKRLELEQLRGENKNINDEKKIELEQLLSFCKRSTKALEVSLEEARVHLDSLQTDYRSLWLKGSHAVKEEDVPNLKEHLTISTSEPLLSVFSMKEVERATKNFSVRIGGGGFGSVYQGFLGKNKVAIKRLGESSKQGQKEFIAEVSLLSRVRHPNIVNLMGVCCYPTCIIYEHLPNGSLDRFLYDTNNTPPLSWQVRTRIIAEICSALMCLHSNTPPIAHRDLKPSNVLLDANLVSKLTDFGTSRIFGAFNDHIETRVVGTPGYVDPEYFTSGQLTLKSDVYAFGIIILEIVTQKRPIGQPFGIREAVEKALISGRLPLFTLAGDWPLEQAKKFLQLGLRCSNIYGSERPDLVTEIWPVIRSLLRVASLSVADSNHFSIEAMQGPNSSQILHVAELEEILVTEKHEKDVIEEQIEELRQKIKLLERQQDEKHSKLRLVQPASSSFEGATQDLEVEVAEKLKKVREDVSSVSYLPSVTEFSLQELEAATQNFSDALKIGEGGFGPVYRGSLRKTAVAIKMLRSPNEQGQSEFKQELAVLSRARHPYLISLIGVCWESWCLVYEYMPNGSLEDCLACRNNTAPLPWQIRKRIIGEICSALVFLHHSMKAETVIHGDLKPSNILLDANLICKISDFGISHLKEFHSKTTTFYYYTQPKGTFAYVDPEFPTTGKLTPQSDVYAFGLIILRLLTGKPPLRIVQVVEEAMEEDKLQSIIDASAGDWPFEQAETLAKLGLSCASLRRRMRPDLLNVWTTIQPLLEDAST